MKKTAIGLALVLALTGCASHATVSDDSKYTQTWPKDYAETTCTDWNTAMTSKQKFAAAADILSAARDKIDGGVGVAPDNLIVSFAADITTGCKVGSATLTDVTYLIYNDGNEYKP